MSAKGRLYMHSMKVWLSIIVLLISATIAFAQTEVSIQSLNSTLFPFIYANVSVRSDGTPVLNLTKEDFEVFENNTLQTDNFEVTPPQSAGGVRLADIVFLIDCSGSMGGEISDVRNNVINFANALETSNIDYRLGLVRFGWNDGGYPYLFNNGNLTADADQFKGFVSSLSADGSYEPGLLAIQQAITGFNFRPGSQKIFLIISDEDSDEGNKQTTMDMLLANSITVHSAVLCSAGSSQSHYCDETSVSGVTGGLLFDVSSSYNQILDTIVEQTSSSYVIRYKSSNPVLDATVRNVEIFTTAGSQPDSDVAIYIPGAAPNIILTEATQNLFAKAPPEGYNVTISATITDSSSPYVSSARLYYRPILGIYQSVEMVNTQGDTWASDILGSIMSSPGVEFYITATDGQTNVSLPKTDPSDQPYSIAVLPNELPQIIHIPPFSATVGQDITINATITDTTHNLQSVKLFYRKLGEIQYTELGVSVGLQSFDFSEIIPGSSVTSYGVEYYIEATDDLGTKNTEGTPDKPIVIGVGFVWQRIKTDGETYTVIVRSDMIPQNPEKFLYPIYDYDSSIDPSYEPKAIAILDSNGNGVTNQSLPLQKKILSLARNAALYRSFSGEISDPIPVIAQLGGFNKVAFTPPTRHCILGFWPCFETDGGTNTSFNYSYPNYLSFPEEYQEKNGVAHLVDWDLLKAVINLPVLGGDYIHPSGLKKEKHRKQIYKEVLRQIIYQKGVNAFTYETTEMMVELLQFLANALESIPEDELLDMGSNSVEVAEKANQMRELYVEINGLPQITPEDVKTIMEVLHLKGKFLPVIAKALNSQNHYTALAKNLNADFTKLNNTLKILGVALQVIGTILDTIEIGGDVLMWIGDIVFLYNDGKDIIDLTINDLQKTNNIEPQLLAAANEIMTEFDNGNLEIFFHELFLSLTEGGTRKFINYSVDFIQTVGNVVALVACSTGVGCVPGGIIICVNIAIDVFQGVVNYIPNKLEHEELQQGVVLLASLEDKWFISPLYDELNSIDPFVATEDQITKVNWSVSSKLYQGIAVSKEIYEQNSGFWNMLKDVFSEEDLKDRRNKADKYRERLEDIMFGNGGDTKSILDRLTGRPRTGFRSYLGFIPRKELDTLVRLTNEEVITNYTMEYYLFSPGEIGIIDPAGRRIGTFVQDDGNGNLTNVDFNQIPGATYSGSETHPRVITIPKSITGDYEVQMIGNATGGYTFQAKQTTSGGKILSEKETTGFFEPGIIEDGVVSATSSGLVVSNPPAPRAIIKGKVTDSSINSPLSGVTVSIGNINTRSDSNGLFEFQNIKPNTYKIKVFTTNYENFSSGELVVLSGQTITQNIELIPANIYYPDPDNDGVGSPDMYIKSATPVDGYVDNNLDCDDADAAINPDATEICDGIDNNCDREIDEGDVCEAADSDGDGVPDAADNCPNTANAGQEDMDGDGIGDACEAPIADSDGDGVPDATDNCPNTTNVGQKDTDGDGTGDACDEGGGGGGGGGCFIGSLTASI